MWEDACNPTHAGDCANKNAHCNFTSALTKGWKVANRWAKKNLYNFGRGHLCCVILEILLFGYDRCSLKVFEGLGIFIYYIPSKMPRIALKNYD